MAAIPSSGSLVATHDYYRRRLGSTSSNSSCGSVEYPGEAIPHHPESSGPLQTSSGTITCDLAQGAMGKQPGSPPATPAPGPS
ncbi:pancreatic progenitor cell differentiation and proliferation factor isoform 2-T2 [Dugong dugon]